jgi:hypothetical protein
MASWKKVITSGSSAELSSLALDTSLSVVYGGTGQSSLSSGEVLLGAGTSGITSVQRGNITGDGSKITVTGGTNAILGTGVSFVVGGDIASGSTLNDISDLTPTDGNIVVGNNTTWVAESGATARTSLGLGTGDNVEFSNITVNNLINDSEVSNSHITGSFTGSFVGDGSNLTGLPSAAINSYTNPGNNRIITSVDSTTVNAEANLTFDGSVLSVTGDAVISGDLTVNGDSISQNVTNVAVEDKFVLFNSGSSSGDGGLIVQTEANFTGAAIGWDDSAARWSMQIDTKLAANATAIAPDAYIAAVVDVDGGQSDVAAHQLNGNIKIEGGEIYIYS